MQSITEASSEDDPIHILEVIGNSGKGGMENYIKNFIANLPTDRYRVTCICPYESPFTAVLRQLQVENVYITPITDDPPWRSILLAVEVAKLHKIDVLHAHMPKAHVLAGIAGCLIQKPVLATVHGMQVTSQELSVMRAVGSYLTTNCQEAYTQALALGVPVERLSLIQNGVDTKVFTPDSSKHELRNKIKVPYGIPLVGFVGRLDHEKGPDLFLRAAEYVHHIRPDVHFVLVGDGAMYNKLVEMCAHLKLKQQVHFVGWETNTAAIYPELDLLVHTSRSDGTSLVLLEAMSCACPVVAHGVGGVPEIIENESTGILVAPNDWEQTGMQIVQLLKQPERLQRMGVAARERMQQQFDLAANVKRTTEVLRNVALQEANVQRFTNNVVSSSIASYNNAVMKAK